MRIKKREFLFWAIIIIPYLSLIPASFWYFNQLRQIENSSFIVINKADFTLSHYNFKGELLQKSKIAYGKNPGNKTMIGDLKTPEGIFRIAGFEDASTWSHDFKNDSLGEIIGAYGPYFIRLDVPGQKGIGIHGTHDVNSIGTRASEGCIRMNNNDIIRLIENIKTASIVVIVPGIDDLAENHLIIESKQKTNKITNQKKDSKKEISKKKHSLSKQKTLIRTKKH
jgi:hypothetical protein